MKTVYAIQHIQCETPGLIADALAAHDIAIAHIRPFAGDAITGLQGGIYVRVLADFLRCYPALVLWGGW